MAYSTSTPPQLLMGSFAGVGPSVWTYSSTDGAATVDGAGYITNAKGLGMKAGDIVFVSDTDASPLIVTTHIVASIAANGSANLTDTGATLGTTVGD